MQTLTQVIQQARRDGKTIRFRVAQHQERATEINPADELAGLLRQQELTRQQQQRARQIINARGNATLARIP